MSTPPETPPERTPAPTDTETSGDLRLPLSPPGPLAPRAGEPSRRLAAEPEGLQPGAGRPLVEGPPMSVDDPVPAETINRIAGVGALALGGLVALAIAIVVVLVVLGVTGHL